MKSAHRRILKSNDWMFTDQTFSSKTAKVRSLVCYEILCLWDWCVDVQQLGKANTGVHMIRLCRAESWAGSQRQFPSTGPLSRQTWPQKLGPCQQSTLTRLPGVLFWPPSEGIRDPAYFQTTLLTTFQSEMWRWNLQSHTKENLCKCDLLSETGGSILAVVFSFILCFSCSSWKSH